MKGLLTTLLFLTAYVTLCPAKIIRTPSFEARTTTRVRIDSIEFRKELTRFYLTCQDRPNRWMVFSHNLRLQTATGERQWTATDIDGIDFDRKFTFPESGHVAVSIDFPPLPDTVPSVDLIQNEEEQNWRIVDIDLTGKRTAGQLLPNWLYGNWQTADNDWKYGFYPRFLLAENQFWNYADIRFLPEYLAITIRNDRGENRQLFIRNPKSGHCDIASDKSDFQPYIKKEISPNDTFKPLPAHTKIPQPDSATIKGVIDGYHPRLGFSSAILYLDNIITRQEEKIDIPIDSLGRFEKKIMLYYPIQQTLFFPIGYLNFYIEPGSELTIYAEMEQLATPSPTLGEIEKQLTHTRYMGKLAPINEELKAVRTAQTFDGEEYMTDLQNLPVEIFKEKQQKICRENIRQTTDRSPLCRQLTKLNEQYSYGRKLLDYELFRRNRQMPFTPSPSFYEFLKELPLDHFYSLTASEYKLLIANLEKCTPLQHYQPTTQELLDAFEKKGIRLSDSERELVEWSLQMQHPSDTLRIKDYKHRMNRFNSKYKDIQTEIREQLILKNKYRVWTELFGLKPVVTFELLFSRQFIPRYRFMKRALTKQEFDDYTRYIRQPIIRDLVGKLNREFAEKSL